MILGNYQCKYTHLLIILLQKPKTSSGPIDVSKYNMSMSVSYIVNVEMNF